MGQSQNIKETTLRVMPGPFIKLLLTRNCSSDSWGFTASGGRDKGRVLRVGFVLEDSIASNCGLKAGDLIWKVNEIEVACESHEGCIRLLRRSKNKMELTVERNEVAHKRDKDVKPTNEGSLGYYRDALKGHGLPGKIPDCFTTCGKPYVENIQYNSPIEIYDKDTVEEMVKVMDTAGEVLAVKSSQPNMGSVQTKMGWTAKSSAK